MNTAADNQSSTPDKNVAQRTALASAMDAANINPQSCLATDYLNHYNEIVMLLEMLPDMPDMVEEALEWQPKSYQSHFEDSSFKAKDLAVRAYDLAPPAIRAAFEQACAALDTLIDQLLQGLIRVEAATRGLAPAAQEFVRGQILEIQDTLMLLNRVIHSTPDDVPVITAPTPSAASPVTGDPVLAPTPDEDDQAAQTQADIDKLFD